MNELKIRAWLSDSKNKSNQQMIWSHMLKSIEDNDSQLERMLNFWREYYLWQGDIKSLILFTGRPDAKGMDIYGGDIVRWLIPVDKPSPDKSVVVWKDAGWWFRNENGHGGYCFLTHYSDSVEVVGNIYENPELLKDMR